MFKFDKSLLAATKVLLIVGVISVVSITFKSQQVNASTTSPFWDAGSSGTGYQNIYYATGYIGAGTSQPSSQLDVYRADDKDALRVSGVGASGSRNFLYAAARNTNTYVDVGSMNQVGTNNPTTIPLVINRYGGNIGIANTSPNYQLDVNGDVATNSAFVVPDNSRTPGSPMVKIGDDTYLTDIDQANTLGVYGQGDSTQGRIKLGSGGGYIKGYSNGDMCIGACT